MKLKIIVIACIGAIVLAACGKEEPAKDSSWCKDSVDKYNEQEKKQIEGYEILDGGKELYKYTFTIDKGQKRTKRVYTEEPSSTYILNEEGGVWYYYGSEENGPWYKSEARDDAFESDVQSIDIDVNDETVYEIAGQEKLDGRAVTKVKITTPKDDAFSGVLKEEDEKIEELLNDTDFKKAYDAVKEEKNRVSYVWFDDETKKPVKQERDTTKIQTVLYYYLKLSGNAEMKYDTVPENVVEVTQFLSGEPQEDIEIPQENVYSI